MNAQKMAFVFPGQGSQTVGMGKSLAQSFSIANDNFIQADEILSFPLSRVAWEGPEDLLNDTINTQPALFVHSIAVLNVLNRIIPNIQPTFVAGHSMGELSALVASGALSYADGLRLVRIRGVLMKIAGVRNPGGMAAVLGLDIHQIEQLCNQVSVGSEIVQVANDNCPGQVVISGSDIALKRVIPLLELAGTKRVIRLAVSIAAHSPFMSSAQDEFNKAIEATPITSPIIPIIGNVTAQALLSVIDIRSDLQNQLTHRVRWTETIQNLVSQGISRFFEIGNGSVLSGLIKRISRDVTTTTLGTPEDFETLQKLD